MRMGQGVRTGLGHGGITCVLQTQFSSFLFFFCKRVFLSDINFRERSDRWRKNRRVPKNNGLNESSRNYENARNYEKRP